MGRQVTECFLLVKGCKGRVKVVNNGAHKASAQNNSRPSPNMSVQRQVVDIIHSGKPNSGFHRTFTVCIRIIQENEQRKNLF